jgi:hypothetical protein
VFKSLEMLGVILYAVLAGGSPPLADDEIKLIPYPQEITKSAGNLALGPAEYVIPHPSDTTAVAASSLSSYLPKSGNSVTVRLGSVEEGYDRSWLAVEDRAFLADPATSCEASLTRITSDGITVVGKGRWGMLYGVQTVNQLVRGNESKQGVWQMKTELPCLVIKDWPDTQWRCLSPTMTWYSGYNRLEGYDLCNWTLDEWKWLVDWSLLHKCNGWAMCMYGNWPFTLPGYDECTLDVDSFHYDPATGQKTAYRFTHKNIQNEFLPELIRYANARGVHVHAYIGKNTFNGTYGIKHPDANAGGAAELIPFHPGVHEYWDACIRRILEIGFNGFVFEDPEALHVPNQNEMCYKTFWEPWAERYGFTSIADTDPNKPPLGVHVEYYSWLFRTFDEMIQKRARELGQARPEIYLISHVLLSRMVGESKDQAERDGWFAYIDERQGRKVPFVILEADEKKYVSFLGHDRVASLGGRGGSCTCAMFRIASINNNWCGGGMGADLAYERACQKHLYEAGGFGAMAYIFEWSNTEVFGYIGSQYLWRNSGVPGINNDNQTDFLYYAYPFYYGDQVGKLAARVFDEGSCVNDQMMLEGVYGAQYPTTGPPLHRDYQLLAAIADRAVDMARDAYQEYTGQEPDLWRPAYQPEDFRWNGFDPAADKLFKTERLRRLYVSTRRSQKMCEAVLAHRMSQRLIAEGASAGAVLECLDKAVAAAKENQRIYCLNYDDDYHWTDGLCSRVADEFESRRRQFMASRASDSDLTRPVPDEVRRSAEKPLFIPWENLSDIVPASPMANKPGLYLSTEIGFDRREDFFRLGVVFTLQTQQAEGKWRTLFRRALERRTTDWEHWDIPLTGLSGSAKLRFTTDSYSRAMDRNAPSWKWALWGRPQLVDVTADGNRRVLYEFVDHVHDCKTLVRLDQDGKERAFDGQGADSSGATFARISLSPVELLGSEQGNGRQIVDGFTDWIEPPPHRGKYLCYLGGIDAGWAYASGRGELSWRTAPVPAEKTTAVAFVGGTGYAPGKADLYCDGEKLLSFDMAKPSNQQWGADGVELHYIFGGDTRSETTPYGISGIYVLVLPAAKVTAGKSLDLTVKVPPGGGDWFMVHECRSIDEATRLAICPQPEMPAIAAYTPHKDGRFGVTIAEYEVDVRQ